MVRPKLRATFPPERLEQYERLVATLPGVERKGATLPAQTAELAPWFRASHAYVASLEPKAASKPGSTST
jgi:hypothetical protein